MNALHHDDIEEGERYLHRDAIVRVRGFSTVGHEKWCRVDYIHTIGQGPAQGIILLHPSRLTEITIDSLLDAIIGT